MKTRKKQKVVIGTLIAVILGMVVGYAALNQILTITGTSGITGDFNIQFTKIEENTMVNAKTVTKGGIGTTTANFTVDLEKPGSSALYDVTVENKGSIHAILTSIEGLDESNGKEPIDIIYSIEGIEEGETLNSGDSKSFKVKVIWKSSATSVPTTNKTLTLKLNYEQKTTETTPDSPFPAVASQYLMDHVDFKYHPYQTYTEAGLHENALGEYIYKGKDVQNYVQFSGNLYRVIKVTAPEYRLKLISVDAAGPYDLQELRSNTLTGSDMISAYLQNYYTNLVQKDKVVQGTFSYGDNGNDTTSDVQANIYILGYHDFELAKANGCDDHTTCNWLLLGNNEQLPSFSGGSYHIYGDYISPTGVSTNGIIDTEDKIQVYVRPVLYLDASVQFSGGTGTMNDPYVIE